MQWEITIPSDQLALAAGNPQPGPQARAAGKSVACQVKTKAGDAQTSTCLVYGGREPIRDGVIVILPFKIAAEARPGPARIRLDQALAVTKDLKRTPIPDAEGVVTIRPK